MGGLVVAEDEGEGTQRVVVLLRDELAHDEHLIEREHRQADWPQQHLGSLGTVTIPAAWDGSAIFRSYS